MGPERRNRAILLAALIVLLAGVVTYQWWPRPSSVATPASNARDAGRAARSAASTQEAPDVHLPRLGEERPKPAPGGRNPFRFKPKVAPPAPPEPAPVLPQPAPPPSTAVNAFRKGETAMHAGDLDQAVAYYRSAVQAAPDNANYRIALERAMQAASRAHMERAREFEQKDQLEAALGDYRLATEYEPSNRLAVSKVAALERTIRDRIEASRPKPPIQEMRERVRAATEPILHPAS